MFEDEAEAEVKVGEEEMEEEEVAELLMPHQK